jgi:hypothetical protein
MDETFDYAKEFKSLDLNAVIKVIAHPPLRLDGLSERALIFSVASTHWI